MEETTPPRAKTMVRRAELHLYLLSETYRYLRVMAAQDQVTMTRFLHNLLYVEWMRRRRIDRENA